MATGGSLQVGVKDSETAGSSPLSSSPDYTHAQEHLELQLSDLVSARASPRLSRKALDELGQENENTDDPDNYPLYSPWTFWFDRSPKGGSAEEYFANLRNICTVKTIKAFWCVFNNIHPVDQLQERESYHLMRKEGRRPVWEDVDNADGGLWSFKVKKDDIVVVWQELLLAAIGEQFSSCMAEGDDVCGISVRIRGYGNNVIQIWNEDSDLHHNDSVIQKVKELVPSLEINEFYQSNKVKMRESLAPHYSSYHRGISPPPPGQRRYTGAPPPMFMPPRPLGFMPGPRHPPMGPFPRYRYPPPPPRSYSPYHHPPRPPYPAP